MKTEKAPWRRAGSRREAVIRQPYDVEGAQAPDAAGHLPLVTISSQDAWKMPTKITGCDLIAFEEEWAGQI